MYFWTWLYNQQLQSRGKASIPKKVWLSVLAFSRGIFGPKLWEEVIVFPFPKVVFRGCVSLFPGDIEFPCFCYWKRIDRGLIGNPPYRRQEEGPEFVRSYVKNSVFCVPSRYKQKLLRVSPSLNRCRLWATRPLPSWSAPLKTSVPLVRITRPTFPVILERFFDFQDRAEKWSFFDH